MNADSSKHSDIPTLDMLTGGVFSAPTSGERSARLREWLASDPPHEQMQEVFRELSHRDKGAARPLRERLDEMKRARDQEAIAADWAQRAQALLDATRLNIADAIAWQRDAARAGAPLSREPLSLLKQGLADRVRAIDDLQHRVQVQRESAVLLAQRLEVQSTKPWREAQAALVSLSADVTAWQAQADALSADADWPSVELKFAPLLEASRAQLTVVWDAFTAALQLAAVAQADALAPLPPVAVWADELRIERGEAASAALKIAKPAVAVIDPAQREAAHQAIEAALRVLEAEVAQGHGKASVGAAAALRLALKDHGRAADDALQAQANTALAAAGELEAWQRWSSDKVRRDLLARAEALFERTPAAPGEEAPAPKPRLAGRKMQETLRELREQWKEVDRSAAPNHALWRRFDEACNQAYAVVQAWLDKVKADAAQHRAQRLALIAEVQAWADANPAATPPAPVDWRAFARGIHQFSERWRNAGHLGEKAFAELQPQWKAAIAAAAAPLDAVQKESIARRHSLIDEARALGAAEMLRIDAVKALQQRWQAEAQTVPLERKLEQKLWDAFRQPLDEAFQRKDRQREQAAAAMSERDRVVLDASRALQAASAGGDAARIREAMTALEAAKREQANAQAVAQARDAAGVPEAAAAPEAVATPEAAAAPGSPKASEMPEAAQAQGAQGAQGAEVAPEAAEAPSAPGAPKAPARPLVAMRGDDRPGQKRAEPAAPKGRRDRPDRADRGGAAGDRAGPRDTRDARRDGGDSRGGRAGAWRSDAAPEDRGPRLGDAAFRAQRDALDQAQLALRKLAEQAHGEALTQVMQAWEQRDAQRLPSQQELGRAVSAASRARWAQALAHAAGGDPAVALLRLEMAAETPTPAEHLEAARALRLQLLTRRNDPPPAQTWAEDTAVVLAAAHAPGAARRLQNALKVLLRRPA